MLRLLSLDAKTNTKLLGGFGAALLLTLAYGSGPNWYDRGFTLMVLLLGATLGGVVGMALAPFNPEEKATFSQAGASVTTLLTGFAAGKLDKLLEAILSPKYIVKPEASLMAYRAMGFASAFLISAIVTYGTRAYPSPETADKPLDKPPPWWVP